MQFRVCLCVCVCEEQKAAFASTGRRDRVILVMKFLCFNSELL